MALLMRFILLSKLFDVDYILLTYFLFFILISSVSEALVGVLFSSYLLINFFILTSLSILYTLEIFLSKLLKS
jgi:hypothetical protein